MNQREETRRAGSEWDKSSPFTVCVSVWKVQAFCLWCQRSSPLCLPPQKYPGQNCVSTDWSCFHTLCAFLIRLCSSLCFTEHETRVMAKERQKKDNHNLSKSRSLLNTEYRSEMLRGATKVTQCPLTLSLSLSDQLKEDEDTISTTESKNLEQ